MIANTAVYRDGSPLHIDVKPDDLQGMDFAHMPELRWSFGYPLLLLTMIGLSAVLHRKFKDAGWL